MNDCYQIVAKNIKKLREIKGFTQEQLSEEVNISVSHLSKAETGQRQLSMNTYIRILQVLGATSMLIAYPKEIDDAEELVQSFVMLMNGCSKKEMRFLLKTMTNIKQNLREVT